MPQLEPILAEACSRWSTFCTNSNKKTILDVGKRAFMPLPNSSKKLLERFGRAIIVLMNAGAAIHLIESIKNVTAVNTLKMGDKEVEISPLILLAVPILVVLVSILIFQYVLKPLLGMIKLGWKILTVNYTNSYNHYFPSKEKADLSGNSNYDCQSFDDLEANTSLVYHKTIHFYFDTRTDTFVQFAERVMPKRPNTQERAIANSPSRKLKMPPYVFLIFINDVYQGVGFKVFNYLVTAGHVLASLQEDDTVELKNENNSVRILNTKVCSTPFPDVAYIQVTDKQWSFFPGAKGATATRLNPKDRFSITTLGSTAQNPRDFRHANGLASLDGDYVRYMSSTEFGYSGSPVVLATSLQEGKVAAVHTNRGDKDGEPNFGFRFDYVYDYLSSYRKRSNEDSREYFLKWEKEHHDEIKEMIKEGEYYEDKTTGDICIIINGKAVTMWADELEELQLELDEDVSSDDDDEDQYGDEDRLLGLTKGDIPAQKHMKPLSSDHELESAKNDDKLDQLIKLIGGLTEKVAAQDKKIQDLTVKAIVKTKAEAKPTQEKSEPASSPSAAPKAETKDSNFQKGAQKRGAPKKSVKKKVAKSKNEAGSKKQKA